MTLAQRHRQALCDTATGAGPEAPTLCEGWQVKDLLAHLIVRESRPDAALAMALPALSAYATSVHAELAAAPLESLVERVRSGPPRWSPARLPPVDHAINVAEFVIHTQDIVRAGPQHDVTQIEHLDTDDPPTDVAAWSLLRRAGRLFYRTSTVGVVAHAPGFGRAALRRPPRGASSIIVTGAPVELLLHAFGRTEHCAVQVSGADDER